MGIVIVTYNYKCLSMLVPRLRQQLRLPATPRRNQGGGGVMRTCKHLKARADPGLTLTLNPNPEPDPSPNPNPNPNP